MTWYRKEQPAPFDEIPLEGVFFLDGDLLATRLTKNQKYAMVAFPSGLQFPIWESGSPECGGIVHFFGEFDLPYYSTADEAYSQAQDIAEQCGYVVKRVGDNQLEVWGQTAEEHYRLTYDGARLADVRQLQSGWEQPKHPAHNLLPDEIREKLPPLHSTEELGLMAVAIVKYFHPLSNWTWYGSEYDPNDAVFFGLVSGFAVELGLFSLAELAAIGEDGKTLPVERDLYYQPKTLKELKAIHEEERRI